MHAASAVAAAAACMRACVAAFVIDIIYQLTRRRRPGRGESNFRIEIFEINGYGQKGELGGQYGNSILNARPKCTFGGGRPNIPVLIQYYNQLYSNVLYF